MTMFKYAKWDERGVYHASVCILCTFFLRKLKVSKRRVYIVWIMVFLRRRNVHFYLRVMLYKLLHCTSCSAVQVAPLYKLFRCTICSTAQKFLGAVSLFCRYVH